MDSNLMEFATYVAEKVRRGKYGTGLVRSTVTKEADNKVVIELTDLTTDLEIIILSKNFAPVHR